MSGKSTLLRVIAGSTPHSWDRKTCGTMCLDGVACELPMLAHKARAAGVATVHQLDGMFPDLSVWENVLLGCPEVPQQTEVARVREVTDEVMKRFGKSSTSALSELSGGALALTRLLRATSWQWRILLLDEPTINLDHANREQLFDVLGRVLVNDKVAFLVSHSDDDHARFEHIANTAGLSFRTWQMDQGYVTEPSRAGL